MVLLVLLFFLLMPGLGLAQAPKAVLINVQKGELPNDASAPVALATEFPEKKDGVSLKATFGKGSFGQYNPKLKDWTGFRYIRFFAHNPQAEAMKLYVAIRDKDTTNYDTRADLVFALQPGANNIQLDLAALKRNASPQPMDMTSIRQWFIAKDGEGPDQVVYFGDIVLEAEARAAQAAPTPQVPGGTAPAPKKLILEGKVRIEVDNVTVQDLAAVGLAPGGQAAAPPPAAGPQKVMILDTFAGQLPNDNTADVTLSDDHVKELGGKSLKVVYAKKETAFGMGAWGAGHQLVTNWEGYNVLRFEAFNATEKMLGCYLALRDKNPGYENRADLPFRLTPGQNKVELQIGALVTNAGKQLEKRDIHHWFIPCDQEATVYFANFRLEKE